MAGVSSQRQTGRVQTRAGADAGFTMLELLIVLAILGLLATIAVPTLLNQLGRAKTDTARIQIQSLSASLDLFRLDIGRYPSEEEGLQVLTHKPAGLDVWNGPYVKQEASLIDPWGAKYVYKNPGEYSDFDLSSLGADKAPGGTGEDQDVTSW